MDYTIEGLTRKGFVEVVDVANCQEGLKVALATTTGVVLKGRLYIEGDKFFLITNNPKAFGGVRPMKKDFGRKNSWLIGEYNRGQFEKGVGVARIFVDKDSTKLPGKRTSESPYLHAFTVTGMPKGESVVEVLNKLKNDSNAGRVITIEDFDPFGFNTPACEAPEEPENITATEVRDLVDTHEATQSGIDQMTLELRAMVVGREKALSTINGAIRDKERAISEAEADKAAIVEKLNKNGLEL